MNNSATNLLVHYYRKNMKNNNISTLNYNVYDISRSK